jgi:hypothetical protein
MGQGAVPTQGRIDRETAEVGVKTVTGDIDFVIASPQGVAIHDPELPGLPCYARNDSLLAPRVNIPAAQTVLRERYEWLM